MATLTKANKHRSPRNRGRFVKHLFDWMAHASNLAEGLPLDTRTAASKCLLCGKIETQAHINTTCSHPALLDLRHFHRRQIDLYLLALRCTPLPPTHQWIRPILAFVEMHLWDDTELAGDIWNGRWPEHLLSTILGDSCSTIIHPKDFSRSLRWVIKLTTLLQKSQREQFATRHHLLQTLSSPTPTQFISPRWKRAKGIRSLTLLEAWKLPYSRPAAIPKHSTDFHHDDCAPRRPTLTALHRTPPSSRPARPLKSVKPPARFSRNSSSVPQREDWSTQLKLCKIKKI